MGAFDQIAADGTSSDRLASALEAAAALIRDQGDAPISSISVKEAAWIAGITETQMRKRCEDCQYGTDPGGFGLKVKGRWEVVLAPFLTTLPVNALVRVKPPNRAPTRV